MCQTIRPPWLKTNSLIYNRYIDSIRGLFPISKVKASLYWFIATLGLYQCPSDSSGGSPDWGNKPLPITYSTCPYQLLQYKLSNCLRHCSCSHSILSNVIPLCICVHICGGWRERRKATEDLQGLGPGLKLEGAKQEGEQRIQLDWFSEIAIS